jgi:hypothetical protein
MLALIQAQFYIFLLLFLRNLFFAAEALGRGLRLTFCSSQIVQYNIVVPLLVICSTKNKENNNTWI